MATWAYQRNHRFKDRYRWLALQKQGVTVTVEKRLFVEGDKYIHMEPVTPSNSSASYTSRTNVLPEVYA